MTKNKLKQIMESQGLNAKRTATLMSVSVGCVYKWMSGERPIARPAWDLLILRLQKPKSLTIIGDDWSVQ
jgi:DNA-binding transcriptional regulator YiaG